VVSISSVDLDNAFCHQALFLVFKYCCGLLSFLVGHLLINSCCHLFTGDFLLYLIICWSCDQTCQFLSLMLLTRSWPSMLTIGYIFMFVMGCCIGYILVVTYQFVVTSNISIVNTIMTVESIMGRQER
jgi:hypothetical protein